MGDKARFVLSASRRTDIPAFYMPWFMTQLDRGSIQTVNPYNRRTKNIILSSQNVHSIVLWSKNFGPFIDGGYGARLSKADFPVFFNFTVNSESTQLEPHVPTLDERLIQLKKLCTSHGPEVVTWRFDPICFYETGAGRKHNLDDFKRIARAAAEMGIRRCITSFRDDYRKVRQRTGLMDGFRFSDPTVVQKVRILARMGTFLNKLGINLYTCCERSIMEALPPDGGIQPAACIDHGLLARLFGNDLSAKKDAGQRVKMGCGCHVAIDIGDYRQHPCYHNCLFCYANPTEPQGQNKAVISGGRSQ